MKNISRRVFIKGMAVAAAATAASTVLAGCNLTPVEETPVVGFQPVTKTLTVDKKDFTIIVSSMGVTTDNKIKLDVEMVNELGKAVQISDLAATGSIADQLVLHPSVYFNGNAAVDATTLVKNVTADNFNRDPNKSIASNTETVTYTNKGAFYVNVDKDHADWKSLTLNFVLTKGDGSVAVAKAETAFTFNK